MESIQATYTGLIETKSNVFEDLCTLAGNPETKFSDIKAKFEKMEKTVSYFYHTEFQIDPSTAKNFYEVVQLYIQSPNLFTEPPEIPTYVKYGKDGFTRAIEIEGKMHEERLFIEIRGEEIDIFIVRMAEDLRNISLDSYCMKDGHWHWINKFINEFERDEQEIMDYFEDTYTAMIRWLSNHETIQEQIDLRPLY